MVDAEAGGVGVGEDPGDVDALVVEVAHLGGEVRPGRGGEDRIPDQAFGHGRAQEVGPPVGALRPGTGGVAGDGLLDSGGHTAQVRQEHAQVDAGLLERGEVAGHQRPVRTGHQAVQGALGQDGAQLLGRPALGEFLRVRAELLLLALVVLLGGAADRVRDREDQPHRHRRGLRRL
ncbi:hypothetical protein [Streptomyces rubiginosohelvolus]|uniref:hypothetical protein n=1 Tax=Streptomyces rubiginosohelvolus TaxID=67362 RepID=UPI00343DF3D9